MIPHKNLFTGALGKLQNIGGSRMYTTPHTVSVQPEYFINVSYNVQGDLVAHSLDGRLWLYRRSRRLGIIALRWNAEQAKLEYATALNLSNNDDVVLACGVDWILTNNNIFMVVDEDPYILSARLFDANIPDTFLYSLLRSGSIGASGIDPFTNQAWGKREDNGNSEGTAYFSKSTHLLYPAGSHIFEKCYSLLPPVGDWQIFENFLVRRPNAETLNSHNYMQALSPLIPLEFNNGTAAYGTGYNFNHRGIQLVHRNGEFWGKGLYQTGRVFLLPAVFGENGDVLEYYLYIQPDFSSYPYSDFFYCNISTFTVISNELVGDEAIIHSFAVSSTARTWSEAQTICETLGGHLASSTSVEKNTFLTSLIGNKTVWLGGTDQASEGSWLWCNGDVWSYTNWNSGEPNNSNNEDFLELQPSGAWNDVGASASHCYICEWDYELNENDFLGCLWPNIALASIGTNSLYGFVSEQVGTLDTGNCFKSTDGHILIPQTGEWIELSEHNGRIFFDPLSYTGLLLDDNGAQLLLGDSVSEWQNITCKTLPQWLAPAGKIEAVSSDYIAASADNSAFYTSLITGFNRQFISPNAIPLTASAFQDSNEGLHRLAISEGTNQNSRKVFGVNQILSQEVIPNAIEWQNIYKEAVKIQFLNSFKTEPFSPILFADEYNGFFDVAYSQPYKRFSIMPIFVSEFTFVIAPVNTETFSDENGIYHTEESLSSNHIICDENDYHDYFFDRLIHYYSSTFGSNFAVPLRASAKIFFINPDTGQPSDTFTINITCNYNFSRWGFDNYQYYMVSDIEIPLHLGIYNGQIGFECAARDFSYYTYAGEDSYIFKPVMGIPAQLQNWYNYVDYSSNPHTTEYPVTSLQFQKFFDNYAVFSERFSNSLFLQQVNLEKFENASLRTFFEFPYLLNKRVNNATMASASQNLHVITLQEYTSSGEKKYIVLVFRSELSPDTLDFYSETERSKLP